MKQKQLVQGLVIRSSSIPDPICEPCIAGKQHRHDVPQHATIKLEGCPLPVASIEGYRYWITFID
ncbi:hypothetical protein NEOLEDRAFT_1082054, partial [Neolentinus lepideus HHB14362 ss-1]